MSPKSPEEVAFSSRLGGQHPAPLGAGGKDVGLKPSGGDVLKPRKRSSVGDPEAWGLLPVLTLVALGKRPARHLAAEEKGGRETLGSRLDIGHYSLAPLADAWGSPRDDGQ